MNKTKSGNKTTLLSVALIIVSLIVIVATTLAYFTDRLSKDSSIQFGKITLVGGQRMVSGAVNMTDKLPGDKITDTISFSKAVDSESMYVRVKLSFTTNGNDVVKAYVEELNKGTFAIKEYTTSNYKWSERIGNYYYLMDMTGDKVHTLNTTEEIILADSLVLSTELTQDEFKSQYMQRISLSVEVQAIQTANITNDFDTVNTKFGEVFGEKAEKPFVRQGMKFGKYEDESNQFNGFYYVDYGYYPQSLATDIDVSNLITTTGETFTINNTPYDVYEYNSKQYIKYNTSTSDTTQVAYEVEPVRWLILGYGDETAIAENEISVENGVLNLTNETKKSKGLLVLSEKVLVQQIFSAGTTLYNNWENSPIREFMNGIFINDIFRKGESSLIKNTTLYTTYNTGSEILEMLTTTDKLFLLSCSPKDLDDSMYMSDNYQVKRGLKSDTDLCEYNRELYTQLQAKASDLGYVTGCYRSIKASCLDDTYWWLRAGSCLDATYACFVANDGLISDNPIDADDLGIRAAFVLSL